MTWLSTLDKMAGQREAAGLRRQLRPRPPGEGMVDLAGNDYLGLASHPEVVAAVAEAVTVYGLGATASRLVRGSTDLHAELEAALAGLLRCEAALVYSSGYLANLGAVRALASAVPAGGVVASDAHNHASLVDGCRLASVGRTGVPTRVYPHAGTESLDGLLSSGSMVVTESVFSVYGDLAPLPDLHAAARRRGGVLLVDDAHGCGVLGPSGAGAVVAAGLAGEDDVVVTATLSKALGAAGGVVAGPAMLIRHLVETSRTFIYDTALPPATVAGALAALGLVCSPFGESARTVLRARAALAQARLGTAGLEVGPPAAGVLSVAAPGPAEALAWASACRDKGVAVGCFRPPSTPDGESWLRLTINAGVSQADFEAALDTILATAPLASVVMGQ